MTPPFLTPVLDEGQLHTLATLPLGTHWVWRSSLVDRYTCQSELHSAAINKAAMSHLRVDQGTVQTSHHHLFSVPKTWNFRLLEYQVTLCLSHRTVTSEVPLRLHCQ
jgi:hypothetical protein